MSAFLHRESNKSDQTNSSSSSLTRCGKKSLAFSISNILSGENNNNVNPHPVQDDPKQDQDQSDDEVREVLLIGFKGSFKKYVLK